MKGRDKASPDQYHTEIENSEDIVKQTKIIPALGESPITRAICVLGKDFHQKEMRQKGGRDREGWSWSTKLKSDIKQEKNRREGEKWAVTVSVCAPPPHPFMGIGLIAVYHSYFRFIQICTPWNIVQICLKVFVLDQVSEYNSILLVLGSHSEPYREVMLY